MRREAASVSPTRLSRRAGRHSRRQERLSTHRLVSHAAHGPFVLDSRARAHEEVERGREPPSAHDLEPVPDAITGEGTGSRGEGETRLERRRPALPPAVVKAPPPLRLEVAEAGPRLVVPGEWPAFRRHPLDAELVAEKVATVSVGQPEDPVPGVDDGVELAALHASGAALAAPRRSSRGPRSGPSCRASGSPRRSGTADPLDSPRARPGSTRTS